MRVLIVGGGITGLALASFLEKSDIEYDLVERSEDWNKQGFLISMWDSGRHIIKKLGLEDEFDKASTRVQSYSIRSGDGEELRHYNLFEMYVNYGGAVSVIDRTALHDLLAKAVPAQKIRMGRTVSNIVQDESGANVTFSDGTSKRYHVIVGADGIHSTVRKMFWRDAEKYEDWRIWCTWIDHSFNTPATVTEYVEANELIVVFGSKDKAMAWLFAPCSHEIWDEKNGRMERLKYIFRNESHLIPAILDGKKEDDVMPTDLISLHIDSWFKGRVVLAGDAAHNFGPLAGIGGSMALEDAYMLAGELMKVSIHYPLSQALKTYESLRRERIAISERISANMRRGVLIKSPFVRAAVNTLIRYVPERFLSKDVDKILGKEL